MNAKVERKQKISNFSSYVLPGRDGKKYMFIFSRRYISNTTNNLLTVGILLLCSLSSVKLWLRYVIRFIVIVYFSLSCPCCATLERLDLTITVLIFI